MTEAPKRVARARWSGVDEESILGSGVWRCVGGFIGFMGKLVS